MDLGKKKGILLVLATAIISGISIFANFFGVSGFEPSVFAFSKNLFVCLLFFGIILGAGQLKNLKELSKKQWAQLGLIGLLGGSIPFLLFFQGLQTASGTTGAFIHKTLFIYASAFALIFLKERLNKSILIGAALLLAGTFFMFIPKLTFSIGHLLILMATLFWAAENVLAKKALEKISGNIVAFGRLFFGSVFILAFLFAAGKSALLVSMNLSQYLWIGITSIFLLLYMVTYYNGLKYIKVSTATSLLALAVPITAILEAIFLGEGISFLRVLGIILIIIGTAMVGLYEKIAKYLTKITLAKKHGWN